MSAGPGPSADFQHGGVVRDRDRLPGLKERILAHEGEFVVSRSAVKKYGVKLLEAINRGEADVRLPPPRRTLRERLRR